MTRRWPGLVSGLAMLTGVILLSGGCATTPRLTVTSVQLRPSGMAMSDVPLASGPHHFDDPFIVPVGVAGTINVFFDINVANHDRCVIVLDGSYPVTASVVGESELGERMVSIPTGGLLLDRSVTGMLTCESNDVAFGSKRASDEFLVASRLVIVSMVVLEDTTSGQVLFGSAPVGSRTRGQQVVVWNIGSLSATVDSLRITGTDASSFVVTRNNCSAVTLERSENCALDVSFEPQSEGSKSALLEVSLSSADPQHPDDVTHLVLLKGTGTAPAPQVPVDDQPHHPPAG